MLRLVTMDRADTNKNYRIFASIILAFSACLLVGILAVTRVAAHEGHSSSPTLSITNLNTNTTQNDIVFNAKALSTLHDEKTLPITFHIEVYDPLGIRVINTEKDFSITPPATDLTLKTSAPFWGGWYRLTSHAHYANLSSDTQATQDESEHIHLEGPSTWLFIKPQPGAVLVYSMIIVIAGGALL